MQYRNRPPRCEYIVVDAECEQGNKLMTVLFKIISNSLLLLLVCCCRQCCSTFCVISTKSCWVHKAHLFHKVTAATSMHEKNSSLSPAMLLTVSKRRKFLILKPICSISLSHSVSLNHFTRCVAMALSTKYNMHSNSRQPCNAIESAEQIFKL